MKATVLKHNDDYTSWQIQFTNKKYTIHFRSLTIWGKSRRPGQ